MRLFWQRAHVAGRNVEQMTGIFCAIGEAATRQRSLIDNGNRQVWGAAGELDSEQGATETATDNNDIELRVTQICFLSRHQMHRRGSTCISIEEVKQTGC